jgi:hypothetical protein
MSRSRGGLASKIHAVVDTNSPIREVEPLRASSPDVPLWGRSGHAWTGGQVEVYRPVGDGRRERAADFAVQCSAYPKHTRPQWRDYRGLTGLRPSPRSWSGPDYALVPSPFSAPSESRRCVAPRIANTCLRAPIFEQVHHVLAIEFSRMRLLEVVSNVSELEANAVPLR